MQKTIKDFTVTELKAMAFEQIQQMEISQNNLKAINQELASRETPRETSKIDQGEDKASETTKDTTEG